MAAQDLTTLAQVREHLQISDAGDTAQDSLINDLITAASDAVMEYTSREFVTQVADGSAREFAYYGGEVVDFAPWDCRSIDSVRIDTDTDSPATVSADDYQLMPITTRYGVYPYMRLLGYDRFSQSSRRPGRRPRIVEVTGDWGFAAVPEPVERATILTVAWIMRSSSQHMGSEFGDAVPYSGGNVSIPGQAKRLLDPYKRRAIG